MPPKRPTRVALSPRVRLVPDGPHGWRAFGGGPQEGVRLSATDARDCLLVDLAGDDWIESPRAERLINAGILAPPDAAAQEQRNRWSSVGWGAAFDFVVAMGAAAPLAPAERFLPGALAGEPIVDSFARVGPARPLDRAVLMEIVLVEQTPGGTKALPHVLVLQVDGMKSGWYVNGEHASDQSPSDELLRRIAPVAFGRAGFQVGALVLLFIDCDVAAATAAQYAEAHVAGGVHLGLIEARASERGIPFRCNYAVSTASLAEVHTPPSGHVAVGAVALGLL